MGCPVRLYLAGGNSKLLICLGYDPTVNVVHLLFLLFHGEAAGRLCNVRVIEGKGVLPLRSACFAGNERRSELIVFQD
jgi:hypothetical protein